MKKLFSVVLLCISALFATACSDDDSSSGGNNPTVTMPERDLSISGTFGSTGKFTASTSAAPASTYSVATPMAQGQYLLNGLLEDGGVTFRLVGTYNSERRTYTLSAGSSSSIYQINGSFTESGDMDPNGMEMTLRTPNVDGSWLTTPLTPANLGIAQNITSEPAPYAGMPEKWLGLWVGTTYWSDEDYGNVTSRYTLQVSPFQLREDGSDTYADSSTSPYTSNYNIVSVSCNAEETNCDMLITYDDDIIEENPGKDGPFYEKYNVKELSPTKLSLTIYDKYVEGGYYWYQHPDEIPDTLMTEETVTIYR
jgi:hypothetical protein